MKKILLIILFLYFNVPLTSQDFDSAIQTRKILSSQKEEHARQMILCEKQKTDNQENYDVKYYSLDLTPDPSVKILYGKVEIVAEVLSASLDNIELNFWLGNYITAIYPSNSPENELTYEHANNILSIDPGITYTQGDEFKIIVEYYGCPQNASYNSFAFDSKNGEPMIWTLSEPFGARAWWPCKDVPSDKADSVDIRVTVPNDLIAVSNGTLRNTTITGDKTTYWWHEKYPIVTYLVSLAIHPYNVYYDDYIYNDEADTMKIHFYMFSNHGEYYRQLNYKTKEMIAEFAELYGEYPFVEEKYGNADFLGGGAMEHQTCSSFGFWNEWVVAHELAHQWWGDLVTCENFHHIWLNEGWATYSEALWYEHAYAPAIASEYQMNTNSYYGPGTIYVEDPENETIFHGGLSYNKASWVLHMLRHIVGDSVFFEITKTYSSAPEHEYGTANTQQFQAICERVSGMNLEKFFHQWIYEEYFPTFFYSWAYTQNGQKYDIELNISQEQDNYIFWTPIDITITTASEETTLVVWDSLKTQTFNISVSSEPEKIELDKNNWILKRVETPINNPNFDKGILLVNGASFDFVESELTEAYQNKAFWGNYNITFWDAFDPPENGYPSTLPEPIGHGIIPIDTLCNFRSVLWIGNDYPAGVDSWYKSPFASYIKAGGNLLLISKMGEDMIFGDLEEHINVSWTEDLYNTLNNCTAFYPGLSDMDIIGEQTSSSVFDTSLIDDETYLIFTESESFSVGRGIGLWKKPENGGIFQEDGGQFLFISGKPYRYDHFQLKGNIEYILENFFGESDYTNVEKNSVIPDRFLLYPNYPNPFNPATTIKYALTEKCPVKISIYDLNGRLIETLVDQIKTAGHYRIRWNASDIASGVYFYRIKAGFNIETHKMILMK